MNLCQRSIAKNAQYMLPQIFDMQLRIFFVCYMFKRYRVFQKTPYVVLKKLSLNIFRSLQCVPGLFLYAVFSIRRYIFVCYAWCLDCHMFAVRVCK